MATTQKEFKLLGCAFKIFMGSVFTLTLIGLALYAMSLLPEPWQKGWLVGVVGFITLVLGVEVATCILAPGESTPFGLLGPKSKDLTLDALRKKNLVVSDSFRASRAFGVEENNDEGLHYFIELPDGSVLYLTGQYLCDYQPIDEAPPDDDLNQPRKFPAAEFVVHREKRSGFVVEIEPRGSVLAPEVVTPPFKSWHYQQLGRLADGTVISDHSYEELKALCLQREKPERS